MTAVAALLLAVALGYLAVRLANPSAMSTPRWAKSILEVSLGAGIGVVITSTAFFLLKIAGLASRSAVVAVEVVVLVGLAVLVFKRRSGRESAPLEEPPRFRHTTLLLVVFVAALLMVVAGHVSEARFSPHGNWDAFSIWNLRAKFLLGDGDLWTRAASPLLGRTHPEYPLLLSSFVARTWLIGGDPASPAAGFGAGVLFFWAALGLLASAIALLRGTAAAVLAGFAVLAAVPFINRGTWQEADLPLSYLCLSTLVLVLLGAGRPAALALAGVSAGMAAWMKEEGIAFLVMSIVCFAVLAWRREGSRRMTENTRWLVLGAAPGILLSAGFRLFLAPETTFLGGQSISEIFGNLLDVSGYMAVLSTAISTAGDLGPWWAHPLAVLVTLGLLLRWEVDARHRPALLFGAITLGTTVLALCAYFLVLPDDLKSVLPNLFTDLYVQILPSALLLAFLVISPPRDAVVEAERPAKKSKRKKGKKR